MLTLPESPTCPPVAPWEVSIASLVRLNFDVPSIAAKALGVLDRFGALRLSAMSLGLDNDDVPWEKVSAVRCRPLTEAITTTAIEREAERIRKLLPPLPGRKMVVEYVTAQISSLAQDALGRAKREGSTSTVATEVDHRAALGRTKTLTAGLGLATILGAMPAANEVLLCMARRHGAIVVEQ